MNSISRTVSRWDFSFWFAVLSPFTGIVLGYLLLLAFHH